MSMPGFVAEASLFKVTGFRTPDVYQADFSPGSPARRAAIAPQQDPLGLEIHGFGLFMSRCRKRCLADQTIARLECAGRCAKFVGSWSPHFRGCVTSCQQGVDVYVGNKVLWGAAVLQPGYCERSCLRPGLERLPPFFARP